MKNLFFGLLLTTFTFTPAFLEAADNTTDAAALLAKWKEKHAGDQDQDNHQEHQTKYSLSKKRQGFIEVSLAGTHNGESTLSLTFFDPELSRGYYMPNNTYTIIIPAIDFKIQGRMNFDNKLTRAGRKALASHLSTLLENISLIDREGATILVPASTIQAYLEKPHLIRRKTMGIGQTDSAAASESEPESE